MTFRHLTSIFFASLWAFLGSTAIASSLEFATDQLEAMAKVMNFSAMDVPADDEDATINLSYKNTPVRVDLTDGKVVHIGYSIFDDALRMGPNNVVFNFLERYALAADMPLKREKSVNTMLAEDQITFEGGEFARLKQMKSDGYSISVSNQNGRRYRVSWDNPDGQTAYAVSFPISYDLLHGTGMVENERRLLDDLSSHRITPVLNDSVTRQNLLPTWNINYYIRPGNSYYTDALTSNRYYHLSIFDPAASKKAFELIENAETSEENVPDGKVDIPPGSLIKQRTYELINNSSVYPIETMANLLTTGELDNDFILDIKHIGYDFDYKNISVPLNNVINYFRNKGCEVFFGISKDDDKAYTDVVIFRNIPEGYCHTMRVTVNKDDLESGQGRFPARLTSYIPISKISSLFGENNN
ncbi:MAG: hypothetical protein NC127_04120 [Muribaculum sp.]|nr:hypothetical protein [Muribaculum sp.]